MPTAATQEHLDAFWAASFGCPVALLHTPGVLLVPNTASFATYMGAYLLRWGATCVITVPAPLLASTRRALAGCSPAAIFDRDALSGLFSGAVERIIGPTFRACADASDFHPAETHGTRLLTAVDDAALRRLAAACAPEEWEHSTIAFDSSPIFGCFAGDELAAAGTLVAASDRLRNVGIVTHPAHRRQGYGRAVVAALTAHALAEGSVAHYQTLLSNTGSLAIARALGYHQYATALAVRLRVEHLGEQR